MQVRHGDYVISDDPTRLDLAAIHAFLTNVYWSEGIPLSTLTRALQGSLCIGVYAPNGAQVGLVRIVSDYATFAYVCDVYVLEDHRVRGLAKAALQAMVDHPKLQGLRRMELVTRDAHGLYSAFGFTGLYHPERYMAKLDPEVYRRTNRNA